MRRRKIPRKITFPFLACSGFIFMILVPGLAAGAAQAGDSGLQAWWKFEKSQDRVVQDSSRQVPDVIRGNFKYVPGVSGSALKLDGFTTVVSRKAKEAPRLSGSLTVEAWVALAAYPWSWCPIVSQKQGDLRGYFFGLDARGHVSLQLAVDGRWISCTSEDAVPLKKWVHIAGIYEAESGLFTVYLNGRDAGRRTAKGRIFFANNSDLLIGMNHEKIPPFFGRGNGNLPSWFSLDGMIDEVKIYSRAMTPQELASAFSAQQEVPVPDFPPRIMPSGPPGPGRFGAFYAQLKFYEEWDALWPVGPYPDIVVQFDGSPIRVVFWRGTRYSPVWVTENNLWMADQSAETGTDAEGCIEHMQDIHCRYSQVRIIENTEARIVVHWRYAPVSSRDHLWIRDDKTGWAFWVDEYYTFYPDGVGLRKMVWRRPGADDNYPPWIQKQETIVLCHPGQKPEDVINLDFLTLANFKGASQTYTWDKSLLSRKQVLPAEANIQVVNLKSKAKPFIIFEPGGRKGYIGGKDGLYSRFSTCNHWPVAQISSDGRDAQAPDQPSHFLGTTTDPVLHEGQDSTYWASWLYGMTEKPAAELATLGKSWARPPKLEVAGNGFENNGYDLSQRAYLLKCASAGRPANLEARLQASADNPVANICLCIKGWGNGGVSLKMDGQALRESRDYRAGHVCDLEGEHLCLWIKKQSDKPVQLALSPLVKSAKPRPKDRGHKP